MMASSYESSEGPLTFGMDITAFLPFLVITTASAVPLSPSSWRHASKCGRSKIGECSDALTIISTIIFLYVWSSYPLQKSYRAIDPSLTVSDHAGKDHVTKASLEHFGLATLISATACCLELFYVLANKFVRASATYASSASLKNVEASVNGMASEDKKSKFRLWTLSHVHDSEGMLIVYFAVLAVYGIMYLSSGRYNIIHDDPFVTAYHRPVNALRFIEWAIASPILMVLNSRSIPRQRNSDLADVQGETLSNLFRPGLVGTAMYIWVSWLAQVVLDFRWRVFLIIVSLLGYSLAAIDQCTSWLRDRDTSAPTSNASVYLLFFQVVFYGLYGVVFLLGISGIIDPIIEQKTFTIWDVTIKVAVSAAMLAMRSATLLEDTRKAKLQYATAAHDLSMLINTASAPIFAVDPELRVTLWNKKLEDLTGRIAEEVMGMPLSELLCPDCRQDATDVLRKCNSDNPTTGQFHCNFLSIRSDIEENISAPRKISIIMTGTIRHNANNDFVGVVGVGQDLTEVTHYRDVEVRKRQLMAMVSHEVKSPLHGIIGLSDTLSSSEPDPTRSQQLKMVNSCATRLLDLVSNIMDMSVLQDGTKGGNGSDGNITGSKPLAKDPVEIGAVISEVCILVQNAVNKTHKPLLNPNVQLINNVSSSSLPIVIGDAYKITQVFYNIVTNACKFCSSGSIELSACVDTAEKTLNVSIEDTGVGIGEEHTKRIFEPFEQEQPAHQRSSGGIGLGLAIAREVMRKHGGGITVSSIVGEGSTFTVTFPVTSENIEVISTLDMPNGEGNLKDADPSSKQGIDKDFRIAANRSCVMKNDGSTKPVILSVDDDMVNQEVIKSALSEKYEIHTAMDGFEALRYFEKRAKLPDLVLLDVMMPGMSGFEVLDSIRKNNGISPSVLPVIMLSATEPVGKAIIQSLSSGSNDYVSKPFDVSILRARVRTAIQIKRLHCVELEMTQHSQLLYEIMPPHIVSRLISGESVISERHDSVCILFSDIVGWTSIAEELPTAQSIGILNKLFSKFDDLTEKCKVFKAETIGDSYIVAAGHDSSDSRNDHTHRVVNFGLAMIEAAKTIPMPSRLQLQLRVGIHTGPAYTGVIGNKVPKYTFFGDTVNTSSRMESTGVSGCIQISTAARQALEVEDFCESRSKTPEAWLKEKGATLQERGMIAVKNKGTMNTHIISPKGVTPTRAMLACSSSLTYINTRPRSRSPSENGNNSDREKSPSRIEAERAQAEAEQKAQEAIQKFKAAVDEKQRIETKLRGELDCLYSELRRIQTLEIESRDECERLQLALAEAQAKLKSLSTSMTAPGMRGFQTRRTSFRHDVSVDNYTASSNGSYASSLMDDENIKVHGNSSETSSELEEMRLQLLVTTKALQRARSNLLSKEEEIDTKELELQSAICSTATSQIDARRPSSALPTIPSEKVSGIARRTSFSHRTRELLKPMPGAYSID